VSLLFRSRVLQLPSVGRSAADTTLEVDSLRRRDGLDIEDGLRRISDVVGNLAVRGGRDLTTRIDEIDSSVGPARALAKFSGEVNPANNLIVYQSVGIRPVALVPLIGIQFVFDVPAPSLHYCLAYSQRGGGALAKEHRLRSITLTGFVLEATNSTGTVSDPTLSQFSQTFVVFDLRTIE
jgi:hypothetical protein